MKRGQVRTGDGAQVLVDLTDCESSRLRADVCVIGSGAAGLTIAAELAGDRRSVIVLEGGGVSIEPETQRLYRGYVSALPHGGIHDGRFRAFGGTTTRWAGQALPLMGIDFDRRPWVKHSGWPLDRDELRPYYGRACRLLFIPPFTSLDSRGGVEQYAPGFDEQLLIPIVSRFSPRPNFADSHGVRVAESKNVRVVLHANVTELVTDPEASVVELVRARNLAGREIAVEATTFVLCAGGIETARLLLVSDWYAPGGLGNTRDLVGRFFQDHPGVVVGRIEGTRRVLRNTFRQRRTRGVRYQPLFRLSEDLQRREALLNAGGAVLYPVGDVLRSAKLAFRGLRERRIDAETRTALWRVTRRPVPVLAAAGRHFLLRQPAIGTSGDPILTVGGEQAPNRGSRVRLAHDRDPLGTRRLVLEWRLTSAEVRTWTRAAEVAAAELERCELGHVRMDNFRLPAKPEALSSVVIDAGHHIGTTRMALDPSSGVVDRDCRVFGIANLYVASSSVFPTSGFSNPTLTIIALALRIADRLRGECEPATGAQ